MDPRTYPGLVAAPAAPFAHAAGAGRHSWLPLLLPAERDARWPRCWWGTPNRATMCAASGARVTYWFGVVEGLLKMSTDNAQGRP